MFELIKETDRALAEVIADETDFREAVRAARTQEEQDGAIHHLSIKRLSTSCGRNLDATYQALFGK